MPWSFNPVDKRMKSAISSEPRSHAWVGVALTLAAAVAFALSNTSASLAYHSGSNPLTVAAGRFVLPTLALIVWLRLKRLPLVLSGWDGWIAAALGAVTAAYTWALLSAIGALPVALAILVFYLFPLVTAIVLAICGWKSSAFRPSWQL